MVIAYHHLENIIFIEIIIIVIIVALTYFLKIKSFFYNRFLEKHLHSLKEQFIQLINNNLQQMPTIPKSCRKLSILLNLIFKFNSLYDSSSWNNLKQLVLNEILLPLARKEYSSKKWDKRLLATQTFELAATPNDHDFIYELLEDDTPIVHLTAVLAAIKQDSAKLVNKVIDNMAYQRRLAQTMYIRAFELATPNTYQYIEERLKTETEPVIRTACYKILMDYPVTRAAVEFDEDLKNDHLELRLAAMRYAAYAYAMKAANVLPDLLKDKYWEVRATAALLLGKLHVTQALRLLADCLRDPVWWVRLNAAQGLQQLGEEGVGILQQQNAETDRFAYEIAQYVLQQPVDEVS